MIRRFCFVTCVFVGFVLVGLVWAGLVVEINDPRYFERQQKIIFPKAEVKVVTFEFESVGRDERGKQRAKQLHRQFLDRIHDLHGGAIITYVTPPGQRIENYRIKAEEVAKQQKAQMALWGRILLDKSGAPLINARLMLVEPPPGVSAEYVMFDKFRVWDERHRTEAPVRFKGAIDAPVTQLRIDFSTMGADITPIAYFLSGLARYYKGAARDGNEAVRWLNSSIRDFKDYIGSVSESVDRGSLAQAHLYLARAYLRLADADRPKAVPLFKSAEQHAKRAAGLNPYDPDALTLQAIVGVKQKSDPEIVRTYLTGAIRLAPEDINSRVNIAVLNITEGRLTDAVHQLDTAMAINKAQGSKPVPSVLKLREQLKDYSKDID